VEDSSIKWSGEFTAFDLVQYKQVVCGNNRQQTFNHKGLSNAPKEKE